MRAGQWQAGGERGWGLRGSATLRRCLRCGLAALTLCLGAACSGPPPAGGEGVRVLIEAEIQHLDPRFALSAYSVKACRLVHASLVSVDNEASEPLLELAEAIEQPDPLSYVVRLRPGVRFHDGTPLTAEDVAWTYRSIKDPALGSPYSGMYDKVVRIEVLDPLRVRFVLDRVHAPFVTDLVMGVVPRHLTEATGHFPEGRVVGAGPYRVGRWDSGERLELLRHDGYFGAPPRLPKLVLKTIRDDNSRLLALMGGSGDLVQNGVNPLLLDVLRQYPNLEVRSAPSISYNYLGFNLDDPVLGRKEVRQAIAYALDREAVLRSRFRGTAQLASGMLAPGHWAYEPDVRRYPYDPERARRMLDAAGLVDPDGPGPAPRLRLSLKTTSNRFRRSVARVLAHQLAEVGIEVEVKAFEWGTFFHDIKSGNFQLYSLQWPAVVDPDLFHWIFHSEMIPSAENRGRGANRNHYRNPTLDALIDQGRQAIGRAERKAIYAQVQRILAEDLPYVSLWHEDNIAVTARSLQGYRILPNARFGGLLEAWRQPEGAP